MGQPMFIEPAYLPQEVAQILDVNLRSVYRWLANGTLKNHKCGGICRITPRNLRAFVQRRQTSPDGRTRAGWAKRLEGAA